MQIDAGPLDELTKTGRLLTKIGSQPVCVLWDGEAAYAVDDRCPHLGFPLHRGTVEQGMVTCHWHHARFDLTSGCTLDPFADDVRAYPVQIEGDRVMVVTGTNGDTAGHLRQRLLEGLEQGLTLVIAKAVLGLLDNGVSTEEIVRVGVEFGCQYRREGWGPGLTVLVAMANLLPDLRPEDRALALVHGLAFVSRDTSGHAPRFPLTPLGPSRAPDERLASWYRRFIDTRSDEAAERVVATAVARGMALDDIARLMTAAVTDHVFIDGGHTIDFTNKAFEAVDMLGADAAADVLPSLVRQTAAAERSEEFGSWRHPYDVAALIERTNQRLLEPASVTTAQLDQQLSDDEVSALGWQLLSDEPDAVADALVDAHQRGGNPEQLGRALALAAALRITRFHVQNDHGDWNAVHHGFTSANALHQALVRSPSPELLRGITQGAMKVYLDRFLNVPAARLPAATGGDLAELQECWDTQGNVDRAGGIVTGFLRGGGAQGDVVAVLGHALLVEDAEFHWFQVVEAAARQAAAWPQGSEEAGLILAGAARFLAAHTPTRRELPQVVRIATRLRRGEILFEEA